MSAATSARRPRRPWPARPFPVYALLVGAYPVLLLFSENVAEVHLRDVVPPLGRALLLAATAWLGATLILRDLRRGALAGSALLVAWFGYGHLAGLLGAGVPREAILAAWAAFLATALVAAIRLGERSLARLNSTLDVLAVLLVAMTLVRIVPVEVSRGVSAAQVPGLDAAGRPQAAPGARDIWYLVFDRYGSESSLAAIGVPNELPDWLEGRGFAVARHAHANYGRTTMSLAATLNLRYLDDIATREGPASSEAGPVNELLQDHWVGRFLQERGYRYVHLGSWFGATKTVRIADENPTLDSTTDFEVMLDATTFGPTLASLRGVPDRPRHHVLHRSAGLFDLRELERIRTEPGPKFVLAHVLLPHEPYVFDESGDYPSKAERDARPTDEELRRQLAFTNDRIRAFLDRLLAVPEAERPIVILAADEGPYPDRYAADQAGFDWGTATTDELEAKYGILIAFFLPGVPRAGALEPYDAMSAVNIFPVALSHAFEGDWSLLPDRSWTSAGWYRPYDLAEVTDRLPPPAGSAAPGSSPAPG